MRLRTFTFKFNLPPWCQEGTPGVFRLQAQDKSTHAGFAIPTLCPGEGVRLALGRVSAAARYAGWPWPQAGSVMSVPRARRAHRLPWVRASRSRDPEAPG